MEKTNINEDKNNELNSEEVIHICEYLIKQDFSTLEKHKKNFLEVAEYFLNKYCPIDNEDSLESFEIFLNNLNLALKRFCHTYASANRLYSLMTDFLKGKKKESGNSLDEPSKTT